MAEPEKHHDGAEEDAQAPPRRLPWKRLSLVLLIVLVNAYVRCYYVWDLYSVGPNGIDERGGGDDILVGEDVAQVGSR